jgi:hypothetical protein
MTKRVAILQSNYLPWKGYFDIVGSVDLFIFHDDLQYTKGDWRNRNKIKTPRGTEWLTIPCGTSEKRLICEVELADHRWQRNHWDLIRASYSCAARFGEYADFFEEIYLGREWTSLSELNQHLITEISTRFLGMTTVFEDSRKYRLTEAKGARVLELLAKAGAGVYLSGPAAKAYLDEDSFARQGIELEWMDYSGYPEYPQLFSPFEPAVSIIDLLFNVGDEAPRYMKFGPRVAASR